MMHVTNNESTIQLSYTPYNSNRPNLQPGGDSPSTKFKRPKLDRLLANDLLWNKIFVILCVIAVSLDPLFFYIPFIDQDNKCLRMDQKLKNVTLVLRLLTDLIFVVHIIHQIRQAIKSVNSHEMENPGWKSGAVAVARKLSWRSIVTDILAVLPIPQVLLVHVFFKMRGYRYLYKRKVLTFFLLAQYLPRIYRFLLSSNNLPQTGIWAKGVFYFFLYILASHVLGAFWYFFSIQRETSCWYWAFKKHKMTDVSTFYCNHSATPRDIKSFLDQFCPINVPENTTPLFDFGIFLGSLQSGNTASSDFPSKLFYSFWWGLRNLSNFGTNLTTSTYVWENIFAILISVIGLLLFLYLIGNVQTFMQLATTRSEDIRRKIKMKERQIEEWMEKNDLEGWMEKNDLPEDLKKEIKKNVIQKLKENKDADLDNLFSILPLYTKKPLKRFLFMSTLRTVPMLKEMDEKVLKMICDYLKPATYDENSFVVRTGEPLDRMIFITEGFIWTYVGGDQNRHGGGSSSGSQSSSMPTNTLKKGQFYGEELLYWPSSPSQLPISPQTVKCHTKVEAFVLMAKDLTSIVSICGSLWPNNMNHSNNNNNNNMNVTHHGQPLLSGFESSTASTPGIRYFKPAMRPH